MAEQAEKLSFFGEVLQKICAQKNAKTLAILFNAVFPEQKDKNEVGNDIPFAEIDPFTFIACLNAGSDSERHNACARVKRELKIKAEVPKYFELLPFFDPFKSRFLPYSYSGGKAIAAKIWKFAKKIEKKGEFKAEDFNEICKLTYIGVVKLSQILYLCFPEKYYLMDRRTCRFIGFEREESYESFQKFQEHVKTECTGATPEDFLRGVIEGSLAKVKKEELKQVSGLSGQKSNYIPESAMNFPLNQILYGPAGTGKTYNALVRAMEIVDDRHYSNLTAERYRLLKKRFDQLRQAGRIEIVTFHSNYSYEEFVEGIKPNTENRDQLIYTKENGIFKTLVNIARAEQLKSVESGKIDFSTTRVFKLSLRNTSNPEDGDIYEYCMENNVIAMGYGAEVDLACVVSRGDVKKIIENGAVFKEKRFTAKAIIMFKLLMRAGDIVLISNGNDNVRAIAQITGDYEFNDEAEINYCHFRPVRWLYRGGNIPVEKLLITNKLPRQPIYSFCNLRHEGFANYNENINTQYLSQLLGGVPAARPKNYVLIIDEINRGDIAKIFGELTTLLDEDKRLGGENELMVKLPYTKELFGIPKNLYLIGTMSVADRQTHPLDFTLRRRFSFIELPPKAELVPEDIRDVYTLVNKRINALLGGDYLIGHGYFMSTGRSVEEAWFTSVMPLIGEYCRGQWEKLQQILGPAQSESAIGSNGKYSSFIKEYTTEELNLKGEGGFCYGFASQEECDFKAALENLKLGTRKNKK